MAFKTYKEDVTAAAIKQQLSRTARDLVRALEIGKDLNEQMDAFSAGKTPAEIATQLGITSAELTDIGQAFFTLRDLYKASDGDNTITIPTAPNTFLRRLREFA